MIPYRETTLFEGETVVARLTPETRDSRGLSGFDAPKEGLESQVHPRLNILQYLRVNLAQFRLFHLPAGQELVGFVQRQRLLFLFPGVLARGQCFVIDPTACIQGLQQQGSLMVGWVQAKLIGFQHRTIVLLSCIYRQAAKAENRFIPCH